MDDFYPGVSHPTSTDRLGLDLASEQLGLMLKMRYVRISRGLSVEDVAETTQMTRTQVEQLESGGSNPRMSSVRKYAKAIGAEIRINVQYQEDWHDPR